MVAICVARQPPSGPEVKMGCVELCNFHFCCASIFCQPMKKFEFFGATRATRQRHSKRVALGTRMNENLLKFSRRRRLDDILVPRAHDPSGLWQGSRALAGPDFLSMRRAFVSCSRPIRFDEKSVNRGLPVLDQARALEPCHRPEGSWALGTRMARRRFDKIAHAQNPRAGKFYFRPSSQSRSQSPRYPCPAERENEVLWENPFWITANNSRILVIPVKLRRREVLMQDGVWLLGRLGDF